MVFEYVVVRNKESCGGIESNGQTGVLLNGFVVADNENMARINIGAEISSELPDVLEDPNVEVIVRSF